MSGYRVVVPMKPLAESKSRLASDLSHSRRALLSAAMLVQVLQASRGLPQVIDVLVVGGDETVEAIADRCGARWQQERTSGLNGALAQVFDDAPSGIAATTFLPGDLPLVEPADIAALVSASEDGTKLVLAPDGREKGTNAILVPAAVNFTPMLGPDSFARHLAQASERGWPTAVCRRPSLGFDLDTPADLLRLLAKHPRLWTEAARSLSALHLPSNPFAATAEPTHD